ncbi:MAG: cupredoxin family copper-binding protein [Acetobacteraceae bacterium]|nr:cupredoxin family copper-binding protein [Acetobacteraceae bacterium]
MFAIDLTVPAGRRVLLRRGAASAVLAAAVVMGRRALAADARVAIDSFAFSPTPLTVARGTTVTWENRDDIPHAIYCPALDLHSHQLDTNETFGHRFDQVGTFDYNCSIHPHMRGRIVVSA